MKSKTKYRTEDCEFNICIPPTIEINLMNDKFEGVESMASVLFHHEIKVKSGLSVFPTANHAIDFVGQYLDPSDST